MKTAIEEALQNFNTGDFNQNALVFFETLGYNTEYQQPLSEKNYQGFKQAFKPLKNEANGLVSDWLSVEQLFFLTPENIPLAALRVDNVEIHAYLVFAIELAKLNYSRTDLVKITRELNGVFPHPVLVLFKHGNSLTLSVIHRRLNKKDSDKDVLEKVTLLKDIRLVNTHRAHLDILNDLAFENLVYEKHKPSNFVELHHAWQKVLDTKELNKRFYKELSQWYFWAVKQVTFPNPEKIETSQYHSQSLIRLLTRLLFVWFIKEKNLVPSVLFDENHINSLLKSEHESRYYRAILQNLFFATLNQTHKNRAFRKDKQNMNATNLMRYHAYFNNPNEFVELVESVVPFMNGGLFDCLDKPSGEKGKQGGDKIAYFDGFSDRADNVLSVPDFIFFGTHKAIDLSEELGSKNKSVEIKGLIDIFNSYKFTIAENTPIEEDIALDPELLGQVFENLLASYNPETGVTARKQTGSFYTPREIVDYMVDESLIAYFESVGANLFASSNVDIVRINSHLRQLLSYSDSGNPFNEAETTFLIQAIDNCKILDPACGSGAFPMGILHKLVHCLHKLDPKNTQWKQRQIDKINAIDDPDFRDKTLQALEDAFDNEVDYGRKLYLIELCIYGVDIQPIAIQISKLRCFISLIVEQIVRADKDNFGILPLPNLETKFVAANTLIGIEKANAQITLFHNPDIDVLENKLKDVRHRLFSAKTPPTKRKLRDDDEDLREKIGALLEKDGLEHNTAQQLAQWSPYDQNMSAGFFDCEWMFGLSNGFDIVIGNPPYIQIQKFSGQQCQKDWQNQHYATFEKTGDIYALFIEKGVSLLKQNGLLTFITSNKWMRAGYGKSLREFLATKTNLLKLIDFGQAMIFESAIVHSNILITQQSENKKLAQVVQFKDDFNATELSLSNYFDDNKVIASHFSSDIWTISKTNELKIKSKVESIGTPLKNFNINIYRGILTGFNEAFIIDTVTKERLCQEDVKSAEIIKPILRGRDVRKYSHNWAGLWIIGTFPALHLKIENYPAIKNYLEVFGKRLHQTGEQGCRKKTGNKWFETQDQISYVQEFKKEKIIFSEIVSEPQFQYDTNGFYPEATLFMITGESLKYLIALLNSKPVTYFFKTFYAGGELVGKYRYKKAFLENLPIPKISPEQQQPFIELVDKILASKACTPENKNAGVQASLACAELEREIDEMVYALYGLSDDEIKSVKVGNDL